MILNLTKRIAAQDYVVNYLLKIAGHDRSDLFRENGSYYLEIGRNLPVTYMGPLKTDVIHYLETKMNVRRIKP